MIYFSEAQLIDAHKEQGKENKQFLDTLNKISEKEKNLRWRIVVLFYRALMPLKGYLIRKRDIEYKNFENISHQTMNSLVKCRNELEDSRIDYINLFRLARTARYYPFEISGLNEKTLKEYEEKVETLLDRIGFP